MDTFKRKEKYPRDSHWPKTEEGKKVIEFIALDNKLISQEDQGFLRHLEFLNPRYALPSQNNMKLITLSSYNLRISLVGLT